ncbi:hypothetical protein BGZ94_006772, partial [Podila epigama]
DFNCRKCTLLQASRDLGEKIAMEKTSGTKSGITAATTPSTTATATTRPTGNDNENADGTLIDSSVKEEPDMSKRRIMDISQAEEIKAKIDECLATNIETDL